MASPSYLRAFCNNGHYDGWNLLREIIAKHAHALQTTPRDKANTPWTPPYPDPLIYYHSTMENSFIDFQDEEHESCTVASNTSSEYNDLLEKPRSVTSPSGARRRVSYSSISGGVDANDLKLLAEGLNMKDNRPATDHERSLIKATIITHEEVPASTPTPN